MQQAYMQQRFTLTFGLDIEDYSILDIEEIGEMEEAGVAPDIEQTSYYTVDLQLL